jgi:predicted nucleic acid-binding protein
VIIDTSVWIDFNRQPDGPLRRSVLNAFESGLAATVDVVRLELLAGVDGRDDLMVRRLLASCQFVEQTPHTDVDIAANLYHLCRRRGTTVRSPNDCLIAAIALRASLPVLHRDKDFEVIARHTDLMAVRA